MSELSLIEQVRSGKLWDIPGGIHPPERKSLSNTTDIDVAPLSSMYYVPVKQHIGQEGELIVKQGDLVLAGQPLTSSVEGLCLPVHAPTSGIIIDIIPHVSAHPSGKAELTVLIEPDQLDNAFPKAPITQWQKTDKQELVKHIQTMGVAGLGGAGFPTYVKTNPSQDIKLLIINAVECEPYITADDVLMRYFASEILQGIEILQHMMQPELIIIAIEDNKPEAISAIKAVIKDHNNIEVRVIPTKYPSGGEKQLIQILTGKQVPSQALPMDMGIAMQNIGTCFAIKKAVIDGEPLINRVVTVTGESISRPQNLWVKLGTPTADLLTYCGLVAEQDQRLIMGGPMMGFNIMDPMMPVVKSTNCILAPSEYYLPSRETEQACIRCSLCADACPVNLLPQQLLWYSKAKDHEKLEEYNLSDCIECGLCSYVCPSQIPLVQYYRSSKVEIKQAHEDKIKSDKAKERFEARQDRLERDKQARLLKHKESAEKRKKALEKDDGAKDKIAAALARAKAKKAGQTEASLPNETSPSTETTSTQTTATQDKVAAAVARAKAKKLKLAEAKPAQQTPKASSQNLTNDDSESQVEKSAEQIKKDKVAATIARAKAKKQKQKQAQENTVVNNPTSKADPVQATITSDKELVNKEPQEEKSAEQIKKDKVAATIARAKAKKQKQAQESTVVNKPTSKADPVQATITSDKELVNKEPQAEKSAEQIKKDKVAATIARAKAKKQKQDISKKGEQK